MQIQTIKYHNTPTRMAKIQNSGSTNAGTE